MEKYFEDQIVDSVIYIKKRCEHITEYAENFLEKEEEFDRVDTEECYENLTSIYSSCQGLFQRLEEYSEYFHMLYEEMSEKDPNISALNIPGFSVKLLIGKDMFAIKTPHVNSRQVLRKNVRQGKFFESNNQILYTYFTMKLILENAHRLPNLYEKNIAVVSVYPTIKKGMPDADGLDTKTLIDRLVSTMQGTDSGECCSFSSICIKDDDIESGTYFIATRGHGVFPSLAELKEIALRFTNKKDWEIHEKTA